MASLAFHLTVRWARWKRARYAARLAWHVRQPLPERPELPATLVAFCGQRDLPEQVASWRSLFRHAGRPRRVVLVSDGSLGEEAAMLLRTLEPRAEIQDLEEFGGPVATSRMRSYAATSPMGRKLFVMRGLERVTPCLYADSDILFFAGAAELAGKSLWASPRPRYLRDPYPSLDLRLIQHPDEQAEPVNGGFLLLPQPIIWQAVLDRFEAMPGEPSFFTEQTLCHLAMRAAGAMPLDARRHVLRNDDQWRARDQFAGPDIVLRHYISSLRHKMWLQV